MAIWLSLMTTAGAQEVVLRNDVAYDDNFQAPDTVAWLDFPECAVSVLAPESPDDYPLEIHSIDIVLSPSSTVFDGVQAGAEVGIELLPDTSSMPSLGGNFVWNTELFLFNFSSTGINRLTLEDTELGSPNNVDLDSGAIAVWVCVPDPLTGYDWPKQDKYNVGGLMIDFQADPEGSYLWNGASLTPFETYPGVGAWVIRAIAGESDDTGGGGGGGSDTGPDNTGGGELSVASVTPASITEGDSTDVAIVGSGFVDGADVTFGGLPSALVSVESDSTILALTPSALPAGTHDIIVENPDGESASLVGSFQVLSAEEELEAEGGCGCSSTSGSGAAVWGLLGLVVLAGRRRD